MLKIKVLLNAKSIRNNMNIKVYSMDTRYILYSIYVQLILTCEKMNRYII